MGGRAGGEGHRGGGGEGHRRGGGRQAFFAIAILQLLMHGRGCAAPRSRRSTLSPPCKATHGARSGNPGLSDGGRGGRGCGCPPAAALDQHDARTPRVAVGSPRRPHCAAGAGPAEGSRPASRMLPAPQEADYSTFGCGPSRCERKRPHGSAGSSWRTATPGGPQWLPETACDMLSEARPNGACVSHMNMWALLKRTSLLRKSTSPRHE